jgi:hypothetical protein
VCNAQRTATPVQRPDYSILCSTVVPSLHIALRSTASGACYGTTAPRCVLTAATAAAAAVTAAAAAAAATTAATATAHR